jgi:UDP-N-acetylmuramoyl-tripeptide--D-alanyl-D-alanine ligase
MTLATAAAMLDAPLQGLDQTFTSVSTDTRTLQPGALFVALTGPNFDGHRFLDEARKKGAVGALVSEEQAILPAILVDDTRLALGRLAAAWRQQCPVPLVAVTGSNGKTTVKEMIAAILRQRGPVLATRGNLNNDIGMPLTLLQLRDEAFAVLEMGANHPGEIGYLSNIAKPDLALITNAGAAHLEGFGDLDGVARAKGEILSGLAEDGVAVLNADDPRLPVWRKLAGAKKIVTFGFHPLARVRTDPATAVTRWTQEGFHTEFEVSSPAGSFSLTLRLAGEHNLRNALAATAACLELKSSVDEIRAGLGRLQPVAGRLSSRPNPAGVWIVDDSYNANPDSVAAALQVLQGAPGRRWLVLGDLAELGTDAIALHARIGDQARAAGIDHLWAVGPMSRNAVERFGAGGRHFDDQTGLITALQETARPGDTLLVKGSRSAAMELVVEQLMKRKGD